MKKSVQPLLIHGQQAFRILLDKCLTSRDCDWKAVSSYLTQEPDLLKTVTDGHWTALSIAAYCGGEVGRDLIKKLLENGVSPDFCPDRQGFVPLLAAAQLNNEPTIRLLLEFGADPNSRLENGQTALHFPIRNMKTQESMASIKRCAGLLKLLLDNGADPNLSDTNGNSPLHYAYGRMFVFRHDLGKARQAELRFQKIRPPLKDKFGQVITPEPIRIYEECLEAMTEVADLLLSYGADSALSNIFNRRPQECVDFGLGQNEDDSLWTWNVWTPPLRIHESDLQVTFDSYERPKPVNQELAGYLSQIPREWLLPPASQAELSELDAALSYRLPQAIIELYQHHGGLREDAYVMPRRLMSPREVLESLHKFAKNELDECDRSWNDGHLTCLFWDSDDGMDSAGIFIGGPLAGKVFLREAYESNEPMPDFRNLVSFYRWLTVDLKDESEDMTETIADQATDYPSLYPASDCPADREASKALFKQWEDGGRLDEKLAMYAVRLSSSADTENLTYLLLTIATKPEHYAIVRDIADIIVRRNYREAVDLLYQAALIPETRAPATKALMELLNFPEARQARNKLREIFG